MQRHSTATSRQPGAGIRHSSLFSRHSFLCIAFAALIAADASAAEVARFVEYIESDGNSSTPGEYILLDYTPTATSVIEADFAILDITKPHTIFCSRSTGNSRTFTCFYLGNTEFRWDYYTTQYRTGKKLASNDERHTIRCSKTGFEFDGALVKSVTPANFIPGNAMTLFASYLNQTAPTTPTPTDNFSKMKLYSFKAWDDDGATLKVDLYPCVDTDGTAALYDGATDRIYYNLKADTSFTASPTTVTPPPSFVKLDVAVAQTNGAWYATANLLRGAGGIDLLVVSPQGATNVVALSNGVATSPATFTTALPAPAANTVYAVAGRATNGDSVSVSDGVTFLNGPVSVEATASATPNSAGVFTVSRPDAAGATALPLTVAFTLSGTAVAGTHYEPLPTTVTIPAGAASATVEVATLAQTTAATSLTLSLACDNHLPGAPDSATMAVNSAFAYVWKGGTDTNWFTAANWDPAQVPTASDNARIMLPNAKVYAPTGISVNSLLLSGGAELRLGDASARTPWTASVAGDLTVSGGAKLYAYAAVLPDISVFADRAQAISALYANATEVSVGGTFAVSGGGTVLPSNDPITGTPVFFRVGDFVLAADGSFSTRKLGWRWSKTTPASGAPAGATAKSNGGYTFAFGVGNSHSTGAGYGGYGGNRTAAYGQRYGTPFAPFLPGSPCGWYAKDNWYKIIAPGSIVVFASRTASLAGTLDASADAGEYSGNSGGGVWVAAKSLSVSPEARLLAPAIPFTSSNNQGGLYLGGGGGRIALADNVTSADIDALAAASELPAGYIMRDIDECVADVAGGASGSGEPLRGTAVFVALCGEGLSLDNRSDTDVVAEGLPFHEVRLVAGEANAFSAPAYGYAASDPAFERYSCVGHVLSNATAQLSASAATNISFTPVAAEGPYSATWLWGARELRIRVETSGGGAASLTGGATDAWFADGAEVTLTATPDSGHRFVRWLGDIPGGSTNAPVLAFTPSRGGVVTAVFAREDGATSAKTWTGGAGTALWDDAGNWSPAGVPTADDDVTISSGTVYAPRGAVAASLTLAAGAQFRLGSTGTSVTEAPQDASERAWTRFLLVAGDVSSAGTLVLGGVGGAVEHFVFAIGGDLSLSGTSRTAVYAARGVGAVNTVPLLFEKRTDFSVGGDLALTDTAVLYPVADPMTGTAVLVTAANVSVAEGATVNAKGLGYAGQIYDGTPDPRAVATFSYFSYGTYLNDTYQTLALGPGSGSEYAAGHGARSASASGIYGSAYGYAWAPLCCGSHSGYDSGFRTFSKGGGVIWIRSLGTFEADGRFDATAQKDARSGASGGSIWLLARSFDFGENASLLAQGGNGGSKAGGLSSGGRICLSTGFSDAALAEIVTLDTLTEDYLETEITECAYDVSGGIAASTSHGYPGTAMRLSSLAGAATVAMASGVPVVADGFYLNPIAAADGETVTLSAPEYVFLDGSAGCVRYACAGAVVSNSVGEVTRTAARNVSFTADAALGPYTNVWLWAGRELRYSVDASGGGAASATAGGLTGTALWVPDGATVSLSATPDSGFALLRWLGDVPGGTSSSTPAAFAPVPGGKATAVFARVDGTTAAKAWTGGAGTTSWDDPGNWDPAGVPTADDDVTVSSGTVFAPRGAIAGTLALGASAKLSVATESTSSTSATQYGGETAPVRFLFVKGDLASAGTLVLGGYGDAVSAFVFEVGGNAALSGSSVSSVYAARTTGPVDAASLYAARTDFRVGGRLSLADTAALLTVCDPQSGTSVRISAARLSLASGAKIASDTCGWHWFPCPDGTAASRDPRSVLTAANVKDPVTQLTGTYQTMAPGAGSSYSQGAGHGGRGGYYSVRITTYGKAYGRELAPVQPGSPNGIYLLLDRSARGGGVVWIDVEGVADIAGAVSASAPTKTTYGGRSAGSVWILAGNFRLIEGASFSAVGSDSNYTAQGGGGRIALVVGLSEEQRAELGETGSTSLPAKRILGAEDFALRFPGVTVSAARGGGSRAEDGTFRFIDGSKYATFLILQ